MGTAKDLTTTSWVREPSDSPFTVAVPGLKVTGWWPNSLPALDTFADFRAIWQDAARIEIEIDILEDPDDRKHQVCAYVRIHRHPTAWREVVLASLMYFVERGAAIAWAGGWECFLKYSPTEKFAGCYAAYTQETGLVGAGDINDPITYLDQIPGLAGRLHAAVSAAVPGGK